MSNYGHSDHDRQNAAERSGHFAERYCRRHGIGREQFMHAILRRSMHRHARPLVPLIRIVRPMHFAADYDFIEDVGWMCAAADYQQAVKDFAEHPANGGFLRRCLRLRVSVRNMGRLLREVQEPESRSPPDCDEAESLSPFEQGAASAGPFAPVRSGSNQLPHA